MPSKDFPYLISSHLSTRFRMVSSRKPSRVSLAPRNVRERKTGVKRAEVITARLVQDERGWLRLAG